MPCRVEVGVPSVDIPKVSFAEQVKIAKENPNDARLTKTFNVADISPEQQRKLEKQAAAAAKQREINEAFEAKKAAKLQALRAE